MFSLIHAGNIKEASDDDATRMTFLRELGSGERVFCLRANRPTHVVSAFEVTGDTSVDDWSAALGAVQRRHPLLSAGIRTGENGRPAFHASSAAIPLRVVLGPIPDDWEREMENELATPFDLSQAPLLRAVLFHERTRTILLLSFVHSITDGMSSTFLMRDLLSVLAGGHLDPLPLLPSMETLLDRTQDGSPSPVRSPDLPAGQPPVLVGEDARPCVTRRFLEPPLVRTLRDRARREGASVFGALCAAAVLARQSERTHDRPVIVSYPIDARTMLGIGEDNLYSASGGRMALSPDPASTSRDQQVWALARAAKQHVRSGVTPETIRGSIGWLQQQFQGTTDPLVTLSKFAAFFASDINLTNLGHVPARTDWGRVRLEASWGASLARWSGVVSIATVTINERLSMTLTSHEPDVTTLPLMESILADACSL